MNFKSVVACAAMVVAAPSMAAVCSGGNGLGTLGPPGASVFGAAFASAGSYLDCYSFSLSSAADSFGGTFEIDLSPTLNINVDSISLFAGGVNGGNTTGNLLRFDGTPGSFSFGALTAGTYTLAVASTVDALRGWSLWTTPVAYVGAIATTRSSSVASPAPEPASYAMMLAGLAGVAAVVRRRRKV